MKNMLAKVFRDIAVYLSSQLFKLFESSMLSQRFSIDLSLRATFSCFCHQTYSNWQIFLVKTMQPCHLPNSLGQDLCLVYVAHCGDWILQTLLQFTLRE